MNGDAHGVTEQGAQGHGSADHLVKMANDIGDYFRAEPKREDAVAGIANHIARYWTKRMRQKLDAHIKQEGDAALNDLPREAVGRLAAQQPAAPQAAVR